MAEPHLLDQHTLRYGPGRNSIEAAFWDPSGAYLGQMRLAGNRWTERELVDAAGVVEARLVLSIGHPKPHKVHLDLLSAAGAPLGRFGQTAVMGSVEMILGDRVIGRFKARSKVHTRHGYDVVWGDRIHGAIDLRSDDSSMYWTGAHQCLAAVTVDPAAPPEVRRLALLGPIALTMLNGAKTPWVPVGRPMVHAPAAGVWHPDPFAPGRQRWFDGVDDTDRVWDGAEVADPRIGVRSTLTGFGTPLTEPVVILGGDHPVFDGSQRVLGFLDGEPEPTALEPTPAAGSSRRVTITTVDGQIDGIVEVIGQAGHAAVDRVHLTGSDGALIGAFAVRWQPGRLAHRFDFTAQLDALVDDAVVATIPGLAVVPMSGPAAAYVGNRAVATYVPPVHPYGPRSPEATMAAPTLGRAVTVDWTLPLAVRQLLIAAPLAVRLSESQHFVQCVRTGRSPNVSTSFVYR